MVNTVALKSPSRALANAAELDISYAMSVFGVSRDFLQNNRSPVERVLRAYIEGVAMMVNNKPLATKILAKYSQRSDPTFLDETHTLVKNYTERILRVDRRVVPLLLEFDPVKGVDAEALAAKMIDNSIVDQLIAEKFIEKQFGSPLRK